MQALSQNSVNRRRKPLRFHSWLLICLVGCIVSVCAGCQCGKDRKIPKINLLPNRPDTETRLARQSNILESIAARPTTTGEVLIEQDDKTQSIRFQSADRNHDMPHPPTDPGAMSPPPPPIDQGATSPPPPPVDQANIVADVVIRGNKTLPTHHLMRNINTRAGRYFDPDQLQQDIDKLWRVPEIQRINGPYINRTDKGVVITIEVVERTQITKVDFIGNRGITDRALKKETELEDGKPLDVHEIRMAKNRIEEYYREKGYPKTQVEIMEGIEDGDQKVIFLIHEDQKQRVWKVVFEGNEFASDARLRHFVKSKPGILKIIGGLAKRNEIDQDIKRLDVYYKKFGFFNVRIGREISESNDGRWLTLRFIINEGPRYRIRNVSFVGNSAYESDQLYKLIELKSADGEAPEFNAAKMNEDVVSLRDLYGSQGYIHASVDAEPRFLEEPGLLDIVYKISEGGRFRAGRINVHIKGDYGITKREVVLNRLSVRPGDWIDAREIRNSERRLGSASIFAGGNPNTPGQPPKIVVRPPDLDENSRMAERTDIGGGSQHSHSAGGSGSRNHY